MKPLKPLKPLNAPKSNFRSRFLVIFCIFVPGILAIIMTTSDKALPASNKMWKVRINGLGPKIQSVLILDARMPSVRITGFKAKDGDYCEVEMMLRSLTISNFLFKAATPDLTSVIAVTRDAQENEEEHSLVVVSASEPKVDAKLGPVIEPVKTELAPLKPAFQTDKSKSDTEKPATEPEKPAGDQEKPAAEPEKSSADPEKK